MWGARWKKDPVDLTCSCWSPKGLQEICTNSCWGELLLIFSLRSLTCSVQQSKLQLWEFLFPCWMTILRCWPCIWISLQRSSKTGIESMGLDSANKQKLLKTWFCKLSTVMSVTLLYRTWYCLATLLIIFLLCLWTMIDSLWLRVSLAWGPFTFWCAISPVAGKPAASFVAVLTICVYIELSSHEFFESSLGLQPSPLSEARYESKTDHLSWINRLT